MIEDMFKGLFGPVSNGMCRLSMNGGITVKTSNGYKTYNVKKKTLTNVYNNFQGKLRYGKLDINSFQERINLDFNKLQGLQTFKVVDVTHCDELHPDNFSRLNENINY